jgi:hypothetical protein
MDFGILRGSWNQHPTNRHGHLYRNLHHAEVQSNSVGSCKVVTSGMGTDTGTVSTALGVGGVCWGLGLRGECQSQGTCSSFVFALATWPGRRRGLGASVLGWKIERSHTSWPILSPSSTQHTSASQIFVTWN